MVKPEPSAPRLEAAVEAADPAQRAERLSEVLRDVCHALNNALGTIALEHYSIDAGLDGMDVPADVSEALANAEEARKAAVDLVGDLHQAARALAQG